MNVVSAGLGSLLRAGAVEPFCLSLLPGQTEERLCVMTEMTGVKCLVQSRGTSPVSQMPLLLSCSPDVRCVNCTFHVCEFTYLLKFI